MKVAFLFEKSKPVYDRVFQVISAVPDEERDHLNSLISGGFWYFLKCADGLGLQHVEQMVEFLARLIHNQEGSLTRIVSDESMIEAVRGDTYCVVLHSIRRNLALRLHESLRSTEGYHGFIQVLPHLSTHREIFRFLPPLVRAEKKSLFAISTTEEGEDDEEGSIVVTEMMDWAKEQHPLLGCKLVKKHVGFKGSISDKDSEKEYLFQHMAQRLGEEWSEIAEQVVYKLADMAPDVAEELTSALKKLERPRLTAAECGQVAVSLRRSLELLSCVLSSGNPERLAELQSRPRRMQEKYKDLVRDYLKREIPDNSYVREDIEYELKNVDTLLNKGVHESWIMDLIRSLAIRTTLVIGSLLFPVKAGVIQLRMGDDLFG